VGKHYDDEFKRSAVRLVVEGGRSAREVEEDLGIYQGAIKSWKKAFSKQNKEDKVLLESGLSSGEYKAMQKELSQLRLENEILKKAMGYLAKSPS
jgi:transposase